MTVVDKMARTMKESADKSDSPDLEEVAVILDGEHWGLLARAGLAALHDSFADPVVRAAIQAALDEKGGRAAGSA